MSQYHDEKLQAPVQESIPTSQGAYGAAAAPPAGYPNAGAVNTNQQAPVETKSRGDGFWKGCCAALCCCCVLDMCF